MILSNIRLSKNCDVDPTSDINNIELGENVKVAKRCSLYGSPEHILSIGANTYIGMNTIINGYAQQITIGKNVSIAQNVNIMSGSGPNNEILKRVFPSKRESIIIEDLCWIGASVIIMPGVHLGKAVIVAANSFVNQSFDEYSMIGGSPARLIRKLTEEEIYKLEE